MLSILIPVYNYDVSKLVLELKHQADNLGIKHEILCQDDASKSTINTKNQEVNSFPYVSFFINEFNLGRGKNINSLAQKAKYDWLLILDCDTFPAQNNFIQNYVNALSKNINIIFGGIIYEEKKPPKEQLLRWIYGQKRETASLLSSNLLIRKDIFIEYPFDESITKYGYEDVIFFSSLKKNHFEILQIQNPTFHLNLETSEQFLSKTNTALENLVLLYNSNKISKTDSKIIKAFEVLKSLKLITFTRFVFNKNKERIERNLLSENPSLFYFDLYKLGYFCVLYSAR
ncbi:glycosyltransferase family 2 protein [Flavobacterium panacagri]|uniref:glycosyltransferase family 2 protein n=1 Tax=Flavobacterium panacagri TaxID=3034146 RepID=UPI0025A503FE|nr:glycosyltransferase family A protein [Flavobacterium panacagri]